MRSSFQVPPDGEFPVMNYRMTQEFKPPFHVNTLIEEAGRLKVQFHAYISSDSDGKLLKFLNCFIIPML